MKPKTWTLPKFKLLRRNLGIGQSRVVGILEGLWHLAATYSPEEGEIGCTPEELVAFLEEDIDADTLWSTLISGRWVDKINDRFYVHDWIDHRPSYLNDRIRQSRYRARLSRDSNVTVCDSNGQSRDSDAPSASASASASEKQKKKPPKSPKGEVFKSVDGVKLPAAIDTPEVRVALNQWIAWKKGYQQAGLTSLIRQAVSMETPERIVAAVEHSLAGKYKGLFEPKTQPLFKQQQESTFEQRQKERERLYGGAG